MKDIDTIFQMISDNQSKEIQEKGICEGKKVKHISVFFQPIEGKQYWENCAEIIVSKENRELQERYIYMMLLWLRDINWPGAEKIYDRLLKFPVALIDHPLHYCLNQAEKTDDIPWYRNLLSLLNELNAINQPLT